MELTPAQKIIAKDLHRFRVARCGRRFGKTFLSTYEMIGKAVAKNDRNIIYLSPTFAQSRDIVWESLCKASKPATQNINESRLELILKTQHGGTSKISLIGWEAIERLRGQRVDFIVCDEISSYRRWNYNWQEIIRPCLSDTKGEALFISTPRGYNEFYQLTLKELTDKDYKSFHFTTYDNPHIPVEEINKAKAELDPNVFAQEYLAEFKKVSGLVYTLFDRKIHMVEIPAMDNNWVFTRAIDFGFEHNTACGWFATSPDGTNYLYDLIYKNRISIKELAELIRLKDGDRLMVNPVADSASPLMIEELKREGINFNAVIKSPDSVRNGINKVSSLLQIRKDNGKPSLMFNKHLVVVAEEFEAYKWQERSGNMVEDVPVKEFDDFLDCCRYWAISQKEAKDFIDPNLEDNEGW